VIVSESTIRRVELPNRIASRIGGRGVADLCPTTDAIKALDSWEQEAIDRSVMLLRSLILSWSAFFGVVGVSIILVFAALPAAIFGPPPKTTSTVTIIYVGVGLFSIFATYVFANSVFVSAMVFAAKRANLTLRA
jgi:hypothetical protein